MSSLPPCAGVVGYADITVKRLVSATVPITADFSALSSVAPCVSPYNIGLGAVRCTASVPSALHLLSHPTTPTLLLPGRLLNWEDHLALCAVRV